MLQGSCTLYFKINVHSSCGVMQLFNVGGDTKGALDISVHMPNLRLVAWFDQKKPELAVNNDVVDWRVSASSTIHDAFVAYISTKDSTGNR